VKSVGSGLDVIKERRDRVRKAVQVVNSARRSSQMRVGERLSGIEVKRREAIERIRAVRNEVDRLRAA
jgi:hypothetical protein